MYSTTAKPSASHCPSHARPNSTAAPTAARLRIHGASVRNRSSRLRITTNGPARAASTSTTACVGMSVPPANINVNTTIAAEQPATIAVVRLDSGTTARSMANPATTGTVASKATRNTRGPMLIPTDSVWS